MLEQVTNGRKLDIHSSVRALGLLGDARSVRAAERSQNLRLDLLVHADLPPETFGALTTQRLIEIVFVQENFANLQVLQRLLRPLPEDVKAIACDAAARVLTKHFQSGAAARWVLRHVEEMSEQSFNVLLALDVDQMENASELLDLQRAFVMPQSEISTLVRGYLAILMGTDRYRPLVAAVRESLRSFPD